VVLRTVPPIHRPQTSEDAERERLATAVRPDHENVLSGFHREGERLHEDAAARCDEGLR